MAGRRVVLTFKEYELLRLLASAPGRVFTRDELLSKVWGYDYFGGTRHRGTCTSADCGPRWRTPTARSSKRCGNVGYRFREAAGAE